MPCICLVGNEMSCGERAGREVFAQSVQLFIIGRPLKMLQFEIAILIIIVFFK